MSGVSRLTPVGHVTLFEVSMLLRAAIWLKKINKWVGLGMTRRQWATQMRWFMRHSHLTTLTPTTCSALCICMLATNLNTKIWIPTFFILHASKRLINIVVEGPKIFIIHCYQSIEKRLIRILVECQKNSSSACHHSEQNTDEQKIAKKVKVERVWGLVSKERVGCLKDFYGLGFNREGRGLCLEWWYGTRNGLDRVSEGSQKGAHLGKAAVLTWHVRYGDVRGLAGHVSKRAQVFKFLHSFAEISKEELDWVCVSTNLK